MKILLVEDEKILAQEIQQYFIGQGFVCERVSSVEDALDKVTIYQYDCILLDLMLPDGTGTKVIEAIKQAYKADGIIIISAIETLEKRIEILQMGADDFITKPFHLSELLARTQALIRRKSFHGNNLVLYNEICIDTLAKTVTVKNQLIDFTKKEIDLLLYLIGNENRVLSKGAIAEHLSGDMADLLDNHDFVYAHIKNLKKKLLNAGANNYIQSVYGLGYKWKNE
jgi:DNA-binding response OmpR family regulator